MPLVATDEQLPVAEARAGEPAAWDALFRRFQLPLYAYVQELIRHESTSLDIVQEAFIRAVHHIGTLRNDGNFAGWLFRIAHQLCQQHWRRLRPVEALDEMHEAELADGVADPAAELVSAEQRERFFAAIESLPEPHRAVVLLHYLEDFSLEETAEITALPLGTVKSRLHYARLKLREQLAAEYQS